VDRRRCSHRWHWLVFLTFLLMFHPADFISQAPSLTCPHPAAPPTPLRLLLPLPLKLPSLSSISPVLPPPTTRPSPRLAWTSTTALELPSGVRIWRLHCHSFSLLTLFQVFPTPSHGGPTRTPSSSTEASSLRRPTLRSPLSSRLRSRYLKSVSGSSIKGITRMIALERGRSRG
jgi:hypothetical protein